VSLNIREAKNSDLIPLIKMARTAFLQAFIKGNKIENVNSYLEKAFTVKQFTEEFDTSASTFFIAELDEKIIGYIKLNLTPAQTDIHDPESLEIARLYLLEDVVGKGFGVQLLTLAFDFARKHHKKYVWLGVWEHNLNAIKFYHKHGFEKFSDHPFQFGDELQTDWLMRKYVE